MNFATIGSGKIVKNFLEAAEKLPEFHYTMAYSRSMETAEKLKKEYGAEFAVCSLSDIADSDKVEAVYIASPNSLHFSQAEKMLLSGKHVLCEKPVCTNARQLRILNRIARENSLLFMEALRHIYDPAASVIKENIVKLGRLRYADIHYMQYSSRYDKLKAGIVENAFKKELSNGSLMDIGIYCTSLAAYLFGEPEEIKSMSTSLCTGADGEGCAVLSYKNGMLLQMSWSKICDDLSPSRITGEDGTMLIDLIANPARVEIIYRDGKRELVFDKAPNPLHGISENAELKKEIYEYEKGTEKTDENAISIQFKNNMIFETCYFIKTAEELRNKQEEKRTSAPEDEFKPGKKKNGLSYAHEYASVSFISMKTADAIRREQDIVFPDDSIKGRALLATDYDGTFHFGFDKPPCRENYESVRRFREKGNVFVFASGRYWDELPENPETYDYYVALNGALIKNGRGETVYRQPIEEDTERILDVLRKAGAKNIRAYTEEKAYFDYTTRDDRAIKGEFLKTRHFEDITKLCKDGTDKKENEKNESVYMFSVSEKDSRSAEELCRRLENERLNCSFLINDIFIDIIATGVGKESGVKKTAELENIPDENIFTMGDGGNDKGMIEKFNGYTVKGAGEAVKSAALGVLHEVHELSDYIMKISDRT